MTTSFILDGGMASPEQSKPHFSSKNTETFTGIQQVKHPTDDVPCKSRVLFEGAVFLIGVLEEPSARCRDFFLVSNTLMNAFSVN